MDPRLYRAAVEGDISLLHEVVVEQPIEHIPELLLQNITAQKNNVLHIAVRSSHWKFVSHVIGQCPSILAQTNSNGETPLHIAAKEGLLRMLYFMVICLCNVNVGAKATEELLKMKLLVDEDPFSYDVERGPEAEFHYFQTKFKGPIRTVPHILQASPLSVYSGSAARTTLHQAIIANNGLDICVWAETFPEMIKKKDAFGWTPLHYASYFGFSHSVRILLGIDKSCAYEPNKSGMYGHLIAAHEGHDSVIREFYEHCPDCFELLDSQGRAALHISAESGESNEVVYFLLQKTHHHINLQDDRGYTPFLLASKSQNQSILESLRNHPKIHGIGSGIFERQVEAFLVANEDETATSLEIKVPQNSKKAKQKVGASQIWQLQSKGNEAGEARKDDISRRLKDKASIHLLVATLIATVSFAAGINMPGGYKGDGPYQGMANLTKKPVFQVFVVSNSLAFCFSAASIAIHFMIIIERRVINRAVLLLCALFLTFVGLVGMVTAFISGMIAVLAASVAVWVTFSIIGCCFFLVLYVIIGPPFRNRRVSVDVNKLQRAGDGQEKDPSVSENINELHDKEDESQFLYKLTHVLLRGSK
ncbi:protein ACCELERATED CELL DEATH 6-like [Macadamia integrifolia]|uniref:protein ACCELERATED CELL DEATH 6-like n=1 Tax=Macadamia integrifolia TaxID=60698 RepID=UPI001C4F3204|nr:protein ACCELERATED CELL DEATH 6-like [Macadamia integrifolia]